MITCKEDGRVVIELKVTFVIIDLHILGSIERKCCFANN